jgi:hypothetical protein
MKSGASIILGVFVLFCAPSGAQRTNAADLSHSQISVQLATAPTAAGAQLTANLIPVNENKTSLHLEPLLLLLLGSAFFSIGTAIKLILSKKLTPKSMRTAATRSTTPLS